MKKPSNRPKKEARITFRVSAELYEKANNMAQAADLTVGWIARKCLEKWVEDCQKPDYRPRTFNYAEPQPVQQELIAA